MGQSALTKKLPKHYHTICGAPSFSTLAKYSFVLSKERCIVSLKLIINTSQGHEGQSRPSISKANKTGDTYPVDAVGVGETVREGEHERLRLALGDAPVCLVRHVQGVWALVGETLVERCNETNTCTGCEGARGRNPCGTLQ